MPSQVVTKLGDGSLAVNADKADAAVIKQLDNQDALDQYGNLTLFVEPWCHEPTFVGALALIQEFQLDEFSTDQSKLEQEYSSVYKLFDAIELSLTNKIIRQLIGSSELVKVGGIYSTGWNQRDFGLRFSADSDELEEINQWLQDQQEQPTREAAYQADAARVKVACIRKALVHLGRVNFGHHGEDDLHELNAALDTLQRCGIPAPDIELALKKFTMDPEAASRYITGPSGQGTNLGAVADLINMADQLQHGTATGERRLAAPRFIMLAGRRYERIDQPEEAARLVEAAKKKKRDKEDKDKKKGKGRGKGGTGNRTEGPSRTPDHLKGVDKCRAKDFDPGRPPVEQEWCTYDSKGNLRGRHRNKKDAIDHKLALIYWYWSRGKGRFKRDRPSNKPVYRGPKKK